jgi:hypothetical protein
MSKRTIHGIDLTAPGGLEALFAYRRAQFGDAMMMADGGDTADAGTDGAGDAEQQPQGTETAATETKPAEAEQATAPAWDGKVESLPDAAQKMIRDLRGKDADERVAAKTLAAIQKALNPDAKGDEKPTAEALTKALTERDTAAKQAQTELAVYRAANKQGADADALLDSRAFLAKIADLDPSDAKALTKAITEAVNENPKLKTVQVAGASGANFTGGSGESAKKPTSLEDAIAQKMAR